MSYFQVRTVSFRDCIFSKLIFSLKRNNGTRELHFLMCLGYLGWGWTQGSDREGGKMVLTWNKNLIWLERILSHQWDVGTPSSSKLPIPIAKKDQSSLIPKLELKVSNSWGPRYRAIREESGFNDWIFNYIKGFLSTPYFCVYEYLLLIHIIWLTELVGWMTFLSISVCLNISTSRWMNMLHCGTFKLCTCFSF